MALPEAPGISSQASEATARLSLRDLSRAVREALSHPLGDGAPPLSLDLSGLVIDPPRMGECVLAEGDRLQAIPVEASGAASFDAFLDGTQRSHVVDYARTIPIVGGRTAAVVRRRVNRRMTTWENGYVTESRLYAPLQLLPHEARRKLEGAGLELRNTLKPNEETSGHPMELLRCAVDAVKRDRERLEQDLAELWAGSVEAPLFVDGSLPGGSTASQSPWCVGVVKSHHTIYAPGEGLSVALGLREEERSSVCIIERAWGPRVLSWYLRLREPPSHDLFMGLVRVEIALTTEVSASSAMTRRADEVSGWILAERAPLALPDARWDRMMYGIRDCEEYLRVTAR